MTAARWSLRAGALLLVFLSVLLLGTPAAALTAPGLPSSVAVTAHDASAEVAWVEPADDGGAAISGYTVTARPGGQTASVPGVARSATVTGLTNGTRYRFTVTATNRAGTGPPSAVSDAVTPAPAATAPDGPTLIDEDFGTSAGNLEPVAGGSWAVASGRYTLSAPADGGEAVPNANLAVGTTVVTGDFTLTATASTTATDSPFNDFSLVFGYRDPANYSFASFSEGNDANTSGVFRVVDGTRAELADVTTPIAAGTVYPIRVERQGDEVRVFRAGERVATATDSSFRSGRVGFGSRNDGGTFDDLVVTGPAPAPEAVQPLGFFARLWQRLSALWE